MTVRASNLTQGLCHLSWLRAPGSQAEPAAEATRATFTSEELQESQPRAYRKGLEEFALLTGLVACGFCCSGSCVSNMHHHTCEAPVWG